MKTTYTVLGVAMVALLALTGVAAATGGAGFAASNAQAAADEGFGVGNGTGPVADDSDRPLDGSNSPWVTGDERLDRFQERFDLTDDELATIQNEVESMIDEGASQDEIRSTIVEVLEEYGVDDPTLGPAADGTGGGQFGQGPGTGAGQIGQGPGNGASGGPHGPADGSCLS